jgi:hypothetical protein
VRGRAALRAAVDDMGMAAEVHTLRWRAGVTELRCACNDCGAHLTGALSPNGTCDCCGNCGSYDVAPLAGPVPPESGRVRPLMVNPRGDVVAAPSAA